MASNDLEGDLAAVLRRLIREMERLDNVMDRLDGGVPPQLSLVEPGEGEASSMRIEEGEAGDA